MNHGKESVRADFNDPTVVGRLREFIAGNADIVLQNLKAGALERHKLGAQDLLALRPSLIVCNVGAFGASGPLRDKPGYDPLVQAYSGMMSIVGNDDEPPSRVPISLNDMGTGMWAVIGVLAALRERDADGRGRVIDVSLYETALAWMTVPIADSLAGGEQPGRLGSGNANIVPYQVFDCADDAILVAAGNDALYQRLCKAMELPELAHDPRFVTNGLRVTNRKALIALLKARFREAPAHEWLRRLEAVSIPCGPLQSVEAVVTDAQTLSLGILRKTPDQRTTSVALPHLVRRRAAADAGQHACARPARPSDRAARCRHIEPGDCLMSVLNLSTPLETLALSSPVRRACWSCGSTGPRWPTRSARRWAAS